MDEPFGTKEHEMEVGTAAYCDHGESEEEDDAQLETQPQTATESSKFGRVADTQEEEAFSLLQTQQEEDLVESELDTTPTTTRRGFFSGIKRKLGFSSGQFNNELPHDKSAESN